MRYFEEIFVCHDIPKEIFVFEEIPKEGIDMEFVYSDTRGYLSRIYLRQDA
jgi:hypothetical protein